MKLRPYQSKLKSEVYAAWDAGAENVLAVMPTGAGKTATVAAMVAELQEPTAIIAHRQELVGQLSVALAREGVRHGIVAPASVQRDVVKMQIEEVGASYFDPNARTKVAGVDTMVRLPAGDPWLKQVRRWVQDECFPAGTLVNGRPIESIQVGDFVQSFDERNGTISPKKVVRTFRNAEPMHMVRIRSAHHVLECTEGHPIWTRRGWVPAALLEKDDEIATAMEVLYVFEAGQSDRAQQDQRSSLLRVGLPGRIQSETIVGNDGEHESAFCVGTHESAQSDAQSRGAGKNGRNPSGTGACSENSRWQRAPADQSGSGSVGHIGRTGIRSSMPSEDGLSNRTMRVSAGLQAGHGQPIAEVGGGSGRREPRNCRTSTARREERQIFVWTRLDSVEVFESNDFGKPRVHPGDGHVYNIEVEDLHTYVADGVIVHNCHHVQGDPREDNCPHMNKWGKAAKMLPNARGLGVTATPARADKKGLGRGYGGLMDAMVLGPEMTELMGQSFLTQYDVRWPESDVDYSQVRTTAGGDLSQKGLAAAVRKSRIVGDVVDSYLKFAPGKRGITFTVDVEEATKQAEAYNARGVPAAVIHGAMPDVERIKLMRRFKAGQLLQLCNCDILGEGVDVPAVEVVSMARKTMSLPLYMQQGGRMLRPFPGKSRGLLIDHVGNFSHHKPLQLRRLWSLAGDVKLARASDAAAVRACPQCSAPYERFYPACPYCGHEPVPSGRSTPEQVDGDLTLLDAAAIAELCRAEEEAMAPPVFRLPHNPSPGIVHNLQQAYSQRLNQHHATKAAQDSLREAMAQWGGVATYREGLPLRTAWRKFFHEFGIDVRSARALDAERAGQLEQQIRRSIEG